MQVIVIHDELKNGVVAIVAVPESLKPNETFERWCYGEKERPEDHYFLAYELIELESSSYDHDQAKTTRRSLGQALGAVHDLALEDITNEKVQEALDSVTPVPPPPGVDPVEWAQYWDRREWDEQRITFDQWKRMKDASEEPNDDGTIPVKPDVPDTKAPFTAYEYMRDNPPPLDPYAEQHDTANQL